MPFGFQKNQKCSKKPLWIRTWIEKIMNGRSDSMGTDSAQVCWMSMVGPKSGNLSRKKACQWHATTKRLKRPAQWNLIAHCYPNLSPASLKTTLEVTWLKFKRRTDTSDCSIEMDSPITNSGSEKKTCDSRDDKKARSDLKRPRNPHKSPVVRYILFCFPVLSSKSLKNWLITARNPGLGIINKTGHVDMYTDT